MCDDFVWMSGLVVWQFYHYTCAERILNSLCECWKTSLLLCPLWLRGAVVRNKRAATNVSLEQQWFPAGQYLLSVAKFKQRTTGFATSEAKVSFAYEDYCSKCYEEMKFMDQSKKRREEKQNSPTKCLFDFRMKSSTTN